MSVVEKIRAADAVIWLDEVQYSHGGWTNRNRLPDGSWLTIPVNRQTDMAAMNRVRISEHGNWRRDHCLSLRQHYGPVDELCAELERPYRLLVGLNLACVRHVLRAAGADAAWHFQSHLDGGHAAVAVSDDREELATISERLAMMTAELGGSIYLSGPTGYRYLDEQPFADRRITVSYFQWPHDDNPCSAKVFHRPGYDARTNGC